MKDLLLQFDADNALISGTWKGMRIEEYNYYDAQGEAHRLPEFICKLIDFANDTDYTDPDSFVKTVDLAANTGGQVLNDVITLKNEMVIRISEDCICVYENEKQYKNFIN